MIKPYTKYNEQLILEKYIDEIYEGIDLSKFKDVLEKIKSEIKTNFKFVGIFGSLITLFFPIVENFITNMKLSIEITPFNIALATIGAFTIIIDNNSDKLKLVLEKLKDKSWKSIIDSISISFTNIKNLFSAVAKETGKVIVSFYDMFTYTALFVPFIKILTELIQQKGLTPDDIPGIAVSVTGAIGLIAGKNVVEYFTRRLKDTKPNLFNI